MTENLHVTDTHELLHSYVRLIGFESKEGVDLDFVLHQQYSEEVICKLYVTLGVRPHDKPTVDEIEINFDRPVELSLFDRFSIPIEYLLRGAESNLMGLPLASVPPKKRVSVSRDEALDGALYAIIAKQARLEIEWVGGGKRLKFTLNIDGSFAIRAEASDEQVEQFREWFDFPEI